MRFFEILGTLYEYFISSKHKDKILGIRIKESSEKLGIVFVKFAQVLSTRYDLLDEEDCKALQTLLEDSNKKIPYDVINKIFINDFGKKPEDIFLEFDKDPVACASIAQVHKAKLHKGEDVAIKIRRPYIGEKIKKDFRLLILFSRFMSIFSSNIRKISMTQRIKEMKSWIKKEIDFDNEKKNLWRIKNIHDFCDGKSFKHYKGIGFFPRPYDDYCSKNVITMDYIDGYTILEKDRILNDPEYDVYSSLKAYIGIAIYDLLNSKRFFIQVDPHPANFIVMKNGGAANIDAGMFIELEGIELQRVKEVFILLYSNNPERLTRLVLDMTNKKISYYKKLFPDIKAYVDEARKRDIGYWFIELLRIALKHKLKLPLEFTAFGRAAIVMDGTIKSFDKNISTIELIGEELEDELRKRIINNIKSIDYMPVVYNITEKLKDSPQTLNKIIDRYYDKPKNILHDLKSVTDYIRK